MPVWLGRPGALIALPDPAPGVTATLERPSGEHTTLAGGRVVEFAGFGRREFRLSWERLTDDEYAVLEAFHTGSCGVGPWVLLTDDARWNYLTSTQASTTSATADTTGWTVGAGETLTSTTTTTGSVRRGPRSLRWALPAAVTAGWLGPTAPVGFSGWPVAAGLPWTFTLWSRTGATAALSVNAYAVLRWLDANGTEPSVTSGSTVTVNPTGWGSVTVTGTPPTGAVSVLPEVRVLAASVTAPTNVYVDTPRLELSALSRGWSPGRGLPWVSLTALTDRYPWSDCHDCDVTFAEVG